MDWRDKAKQAMQSKRLTYEQLGDMLGLTGGAVSHWLNGHREPSVYNLKRLAAILGVPIGELLGDDAMVVTDAEEKAFLERLRRLPQPQREMLLQMLNGLEPDNLN